MAALSLLYSYCLDVTLHKLCLLIWQTRFEWSIVTKETLLAVFKPKLKHSNNCILPCEFLCHPLGLAKHNLQNLVGISSWLWKACFPLGGCYTVSMTPISVKVVLPQLHKSNKDPFC